MPETVNHPKHYNSHPSGIEVIDIVENFSFCLGNAWKYLARHKQKGKPVEDLEKALWYVRRAMGNPSRIRAIDNDFVLLTLQWIDACQDSELRLIYDYISAAELASATHRYFDLFDTYIKVAESKLIKYIKEIKKANVE